MKKRNDEFLKLSDQKNVILSHKKDVLELNQKLRLQVNSESDPAWIELVLMKELGLTPEEQTKVFFPS